MTIHNGKTFGDFSEGASGLSVGEVLQKLQTAEPVQGETKMANVPMMKLYARSFRNTNEDLCGVNVHFNNEGIGYTESFNRGAVERWDSLRQGILVILEDEAVVKPVDGAVLSDGTVAVTPEEVLPLDGVPAPKVLTEEKEAVWFKPVGHRHTATEEFVDYEPMYTDPPSKEELDAMYDAVLLKDPEEEVLPLSVSEEVLAKDAVLAAAVEAGKVSPVNADYSLQKVLDQLEATSEEETDEQVDALVDQDVADGVVAAEDAPEVKKKAKGRPRKDPQSTPPWDGNK